MTDEEKKCPSHPNEASRKVTRHGFWWYASGVLYKAESVFKLYKHKLDKCEGLIAVSTEK